MFATNRKRKSQFLVFLVMTMFIITTLISPFSGRANTPVAMKNTYAAAARTASPPAPVQSSPAFDKLLQDNSSNDMLRFNSTTGAYQFSRCSSGYVLTGTATISLRGCTYTLSHITSDRRVQASFDSCANRGTASVQVFAPSATYNITDSNTTNNPGNADSIVPQVNILSPNGSELIDAGSSFTITWNASDNIGVTRQDVLLSTDGGTTYSVLIQGLAGDVKQYTWIAPLISSTQTVRVRVIAYDAACNIGSDDSDANFTIVNSSTAFSQVAETPVYMVGSGYRSLIHLFSTSANNITVEIGIRNRFGTGLVSLPTQFTLTPGQARAINVANYLTPTNPPTAGDPNILMGSIRLRHTGSLDCEVRAVVVVDHNNEDQSFTVPFTYLASAQSATSTVQQSPLYYIDSNTSANMSLQNTTNAPVQVSATLHYGTGAPNTPNGNYALPFFTLAAQASAVIDLSQFADQLQGTQWGSITLNTPPQTVVAHTVMRSAANRLAFSSAFVDPAKLASSNKVISSLKLDYGMNLKSSLMVRNVSDTETRNVTVSFQTDNGVSIPAQQIILAAGEQRLIELDSQQLLSANGSTRAIAQISYSGNAADVIGNAVSMSCANSCAIPAQLLASATCDSGRRLVSPFFRFDERTSGILQLTNFSSSVVKAGATMKFADTTLPTLNTDLITIPAGGTVTVDLQSYFSLVDDGVAAQGALEVFHNGVAGSVSGTFTALGKYNELSLPVVLEGAPALAATDMRLFPNAKELQPNDATEVSVLTGGNLGSPVWSVSSTTGNPGSITPLASADANIYRASYVASSDPNTLTVALKADATSSSGGIKSGTITLQKVKLTEFSTALGNGRLNPKANTNFTIRGNVDFPDSGLVVRFKQGILTVDALTVIRNESDPKVLTGIAPTNTTFVGDAQILVLQNSTKISKDNTGAAYYAFNPPTPPTSVAPADGFNRQGGILTINGTGYETFNDLKPQVNIEGIDYTVNTVMATQLTGLVGRASNQISSCTVVGQSPCKFITIKNPGGRNADRVRSNIPLYNLKPGPTPVLQEFPNLVTGFSTGGPEVAIFGTNLDFVRTITFSSVRAEILSQRAGKIVVIAPPNCKGASPITAFDIDGGSTMLGGFQYVAVTPIQVTPTAIPGLGYVFIVGGCSESVVREIYGESQWTLLKKLIEERKPATIAINVSHTHAFSDGLSSGEREKLESTLSPEYSKRLVRAENLALEYVALRLPEMMPVYKQMMETVHSLISRAFSNEVIKPGKTTNEDVVWWLRQEVNNRGLGTWFQPSVSVQKSSNTNARPPAEDEPVVIDRGDVLHVDFGITTMRLNTDTQHMGYVLREGESDVPAGLKKALANANRLQDILTERMKPGRTGNEVLQEALEQMKKEKINGTIYTHPIGDHGHGAGPLIGLWDRQQGVPGRGDVSLLPGTWFSIELQATTPVAEWGGKEVSVGEEEDGVLDEQGRFSWILKRQTEYHLVK